MARQAEFCWNIGGLSELQGNWVGRFKFVKVGRGGREKRRHSNGTYATFHGKKKRACRSRMGKVYHAMGGESQG